MGFICCGFGLRVGVVFSGVIDDLVGFPLVSFVCGLV